MSGRPRRYTRYPKYKDAGVDWLGEVPMHWDVKSAWQAVQMIMDFRGRTPVKLGADWGGEIAAVSAANVRDGHIELSAGVNYGSRALHDRWMTDGPTRKNDIVFTTEAPLGNVALIPDDQPYILSQRVVLLRPEPSHFAPRYLQRLMSSSAFRHGVEARATGSTAEGIKRRYLMTIPVVEPPLDEQFAITQFLDRKTTTIDELIAEKRRLMELLQEKRSAVMTHAVTKGLDPNAPMKNSGIQWLGEVPAHWQVMHLGRVVTRIEQGWSPVADDREALPDEWAVIKLSAVSPNRFVPREHKALPPEITPDLRYEVREGDFLLTRSNTPELVGAACVVRETRSKLMLCDLVYRLDLLRTRVRPGFLAYWLSSSAGRYQVEVEARGASQSMVKISQGLIRAWSVVLPPVSEQEEIQSFLDREIATLDKLIRRVRDAMTALQHLRIALITAATTGKIDVREEVA